MRTTIFFAALFILALAGCDLEKNRPRSDLPPLDATADEVSGSADTSLFDLATADIPPLPGEFGTPCTDNPECNSGFCIETLNGLRCTTTCVSECPAGFVCRQKDGGDPVYVCMSEKLPEKCNGKDDDGDDLIDEGLCEDGNPCTLEQCDESGKCVYTEQNTQPCDDGSVCTEIDKCYGAVCKGAKALICLDGNVCTNDDGCDPISGCLFPFNSESCDDGNPCTVQDTCKGGVCVVSKPRVCNDGNPCTTDSCKPELGPTGCLFKAVADGVAPIGEGGCAPTLPYCKGGKCSPLP